MRKIIATVLMSAGLLFAGLSGVSANEGRSLCSDVSPDLTGTLVSDVAHTAGINADSNPGNSNNEFPPFVPFVVGCNPAD